MLRRLINSGKRRAPWAVPFSVLWRDVQPAHDPRLRDLFDEAGIAFIHIPKCAGSSVSDAIYNHSIKHRTWQETRALDPDAFDNRWLKVAVVREPVDRFLSAYDYIAAGGRNAHDREFSRRMLRQRDINAFVSALDTRRRYRAKVMSWFHFQPQSMYITDSAGRVMVDRLVPFERLGETLDALLGRAGAVPHTNRTRGDRTPRQSLTSDSMAILRELYAGDHVLYESAVAGADGALGDGPTKESQPPAASRSRTAPR